MLVATVMAFDDVVRQLDKTQVVAVITQRRDGTRAATPIWAMVVDGVPYVRSAYGPGSWWYRHALSGREVAFALGDGALAERDRAAALELPAEAVGVQPVPEDDPVQAKIDAELDRKYAAEPSSIAEMKTPGAMATTLRVVAAA